MPPAPLEQLHELLLEHLRQGGLRRELLETLRRELDAGHVGSANSRLLRTVQFALDGSVEVEALTLGGERYTVEAKASSTVLELKGSLEALTGIPPFLQLLSKDGRELPDARPLAACGLSPLRPDVSLVRRAAHEQLFAVGGYDTWILDFDGGNVLASAAAFDPAEGSWAPLPATPIRRARCAAAAAANRIYIVGGYIAARQATARADAFLLDARAWRQLPDMSQHRAACAAAVVEGTLVVMGGGDPALNVTYASMEALPPDAELWSFLPDMARGRSRHAAAARGSRVYVTGGWDASAQIPHLDLAEAFDVHTRSWLPLAPMLGPRRAHASAWLQDRLYVVGGHREPHQLAEVESFDPESGLWSSVAPMLEARSNLGVGVLDGKLFVFGGHQFGQPKASAEVFDPESESWSPSPAMASPRMGFAAGVSLACR